MCEQCNQLEPEQTPVIWGERPDFRQIAYKLLNETEPANREEVNEWLRNISIEPIYHV